MAKVIVISKASKPMLAAGLNTGARFGEKAMATIWDRMAEAAEPIEAWSSDCDCGSCEDCDLRLYLLDRGLTAFKL